MELIRGIHNLRPQHQDCVLSIGNFDGVHLGHQALLQKLKLQGQRLNAPVMVMIFEPQPLEYFATHHSPPRLSRLRDKVKYLTELGVDYLLCVEFKGTFPLLSAEDFIAELLVKQLAVKFLVIGDDFRFGAERVGDINLLKALSQKYHFTVVNTDSFLSGNGKRISSTMIRHALADDDLQASEAMLGHPYSISGRVVHGDALGRTLGFPTANIHLKNIKAAVNGVYAVEVSGVAEHLLPGIANIGTRPTIAGIRQQLEVHLLDFSGNLYGKHIDVIIRKKLRNEQRFASLELLKQQIAIDETAARVFFAANDNELDNL